MEPPVGLIPSLPRISLSIQTIGCSPVPANTGVAPTPKSKWKMTTTWQTWIQAKNILKSPLDYHAIKPKDSKSKLPPTIHELSGHLNFSPNKCMLSRVWLFTTSWTVAHQAPGSMGFSRQDTGVGCHFLLWGIIPTQGWNPRPPHLLHWWADSSPLGHLGSVPSLAHPQRCLDDMRCYLPSSVLSRGLAWSWTFSRCWEHQDCGMPPWGWLPPTWPLVLWPLVSLLCSDDGLRRTFPLLRG